MHISNNIDIQIFEDNQNVTDISEEEAVTVTTK